jgi:hypothetical protein
VNDIFNFDVYDFVHLGNVYVPLEVRLDVHGFILVCILYSSLLLALHVSSAICTHPQEHKLQSTALGVCNSCGMLVHWNRYWLGHRHNFSTVKFRMETPLYGIACSELQNVINL